MESKPKNREWVKNAAIIFLIILLILTFFSNTIMNIALPEVATQMVDSGSIVAKVRGTGTVAANGFYEVKADQTREIRTVNVRAGQVVNAGDVLFTLGSGDSEELKAAQEELHSLEMSYQTAALSVPVYHYYSQDAEIESAQRDLADAQEQVDLAEARWIKYISEEGYNPDEVKDIINKVADAKDEYDTAKGYYDKINAADEALELATAELAAAEQNLPALEKAKNDAQGELDKINEDPASTPEQKKEAQTALDKANEEYNAGADLIASSKTKKADAEKAVSDALAEYAASPKKAKELEGKGETEIRITVENDMLETQKKYDALWKFLNEQNNEYWSAYRQAESQRDAAQNRVWLLQNQRDELIESNNRSAAASYINLNDIAGKIEKKKAEIEELSGGTENQILANVSGMVQNVSCTAGSKVPAGEVLCTIEIPDQGYSVSFAVTSEQARRLHTGDTATVSNYYWGREIIATLVSIKTDPKNPQGSKILEFDLKGEVNAGADLTISVGQKSANYDLVVPNSSIRRDGNGTFVYAIEAKNSPLGNRYYAKRVKVEVIASDDINSAVTGDLNAWSDYVITTSSTIINNKDQVRMADS